MATIHLTTGEKIEVEETNTGITNMIDWTNKPYIVVKMRNMEYRQLKNYKWVTHGSEYMPITIFVNHIAYIQ